MLCYAMPCYAMRNTGQLWLCPWAGDSLPTGFRHPVWRHSLWRTAPCSDSFEPVPCITHASNTCYQLLLWRPVGQRWL
jgi:hypothetical protein